MTTPCPNILQFAPEVWAHSAAEVIHAAVRVSAECHRGHSSLLLTGGRAAARVYAAWAPLLVKEPTLRLSVFWSDERCVAPDHPESNYGMTRAQLFPSGVREGWDLHRIEGEAEDLEAEARRYEAVLPFRLNVAVLGVGEDGHVASLFPRASSLRESRRRVIHVTSPKPPFCRLTITPPVLGAVDSIFILAPGHEKAAVLTRATAEPAELDSVPARLVLGGTWLLDHDS